MSDTASGARISWYMLVDVVIVVHFAMLPPKPDNHSSSDVSMVLRQLQRRISLTGIDVGVQLHSVCDPVE